MLPIFSFSGRRGLSVAVIITLLCLPSVANAADELPSREEMWEMIQQQQKQINQLLKQQQQTQARVENTDRKVEATAEKVEEVQTIAAVSPTAGGHGHGGPGWWNNTQIGGYGELHYNGGDEDQIDLHRFVLFASHDFTDRIRLFTELEVEHALVKDTADGSNGGEVEVEQAFIEFDLDEAANHRAKAGVFLIPTGILNETHEPTTFFGVERNNVEKNIIPTTWWEGGVAYQGQFDNGFSTDLAFHSGLKVPTTGSNAYKIRSGRQKVSEADAKDPAVTGRVKWTGMPGVELSASGQWQRNITQGVDPDADATMIEAHADIRKGPFGLRVLGARFDIDGSGAEAVGRDIQEGFYAEPAYYFDTPLGDAGVFARYEFHDNTAGDSTDSEIEEYVTGVNFWPHPDVVLKADFQHIDAAPGDNSDDILNLGVGFVF